MRFQGKKGTIWASPTLLYTHLTGFHPHRSSDCFYPGLFLSRSAMAPMLLNLGHVLVPILLNMSAVFHTVVHFLLLKRLSSLDSQEATLASLPVSWSLLLSLLCWLFFISPSSEHQDPVPELWAPLLSPEVILPHCRVLHISYCP